MYGVKGDNASNYKLFTQVLPLFGAMNLVKSFLCENEILLLYTI